MGKIERYVVLAFANLKYLLWQLLTKVLLGVIYVAVIAEGLRFLVPALGQRLYKLPGLGELKNYEGTYRLDLAPFLAVFILIAVWHLWDKILQLFLLSHWREDHAKWNRANEIFLTLVLGITVLGADAALFYVAMVQLGWQGTTFSLPALLATVAYLAVLIFVTFVSISLREEVKTLENLNWEESQ